MRAMPAMPAIPATMAKRAMPATQALTAMPATPAGRNSGGQALRPVRRLAGRVRYLPTYGRRPAMPDFFEQPILNSPYEYPDRHWELDNEGQPDGRIRF